MRLTTRTNLAMRTLMYCAVNKNSIVRKHGIAQACGASENHLAQVIHLLARAGYLKTIRGRAGGLCLARPADQINVGAVFRSFEGVLPFTACSEPDGDCPLLAACRLQCEVNKAVEAFYASLDQVTLHDLVMQNKPLHQLLQVA